MNLNPIADKLTDIIKSECEKIIEEIAYENNLDKDELIEKHLPNDLIKNFCCKNEKKKTRQRKCVPIDEMCLGRKIDLTQCTRRRKGDKLFCATHSNNLPFGRIDDGKEYGTSNKDIHNNNDYIAMMIFEHNDETFLIDNNNIVYTYDVENPIRIGIKNDDNELVKIKLEEHNGIEYMIDTNNNVYSSDVENPRFIGKKYDNEIIFQE